MGGLKLCCGGIWHCGLQSGKSPVRPRIPIPLTRRGESSILLEGSGWNSGLRKVNWVMDEARGQGTLFWPCVLAIPVLYNLIIVSAGIQCSPYGRFLPDSMMGTGSLAFGTSFLVFTCDAAQVPSFSFTGGLAAGYNGYALS